MKKILLSFFLFFILPFITYSQYSISGYSCVLPNNYYGPYTVSGWDYRVSDKWCVTGGTINNTGNTCVTNNGTPSIGVTWDLGISTGSISYYVGSSTTPVATFMVTVVPNTIGLPQLSTPCYYPFVPIGQPVNVSIAGSEASICSAIPSYLWEISTDNVNFTPLPNSSSRDYTGGGSFTQTSFIRRTLYMDNFHSTSNVFYISPSAPLYAGIVSPGYMLNLPTTYTATPATGGTMCGGNYTYNWQTSTDNINWTTVSSGSTPSSYSPGAVSVKTYIRQQAICGPMVSNSNVAVADIYSSTLQGGIISPCSITIASNTDPGTLLGSPASLTAPADPNAVIVYAWQSSTDGVNFSPVSPAAYTKDYNPGSLSTTTYFRRQAYYGTFAYSNTVTVNVGTIWSSTNYVQTRMITKPGVITGATADALTDLADAKQTTTYLDGLGRPLQTVAKQGSIINGTAFDVVALAQYDAVGRESLKYLPYVSSTPFSNGGFKANALSNQSSFNAAQFPGETFYYGQINYEASSLNRVSSSSAPGTNWTGSNRATTMVYGANTANDNVIRWGVINSGSASSFSSYTGVGIYPAGTLYKNITADEQGAQVIEFKDFEGKLILKKVQLTANKDDGTGSGYGGWLCTHYIYDIIGNLRAVVQPAAIAAMAASYNWTLTPTILAEQCFRYQYDTRNRMTMKKVPGAGEVYMVYDNLDRLVMTQDANMRTASNWLVTVYDAFDRPVQTGMLPNSTPFATLLAQASTSTSYPSTSGMTLLTQSHYDDYTSLPSGLSPSLLTSVASLSWNNEFNTTTGSFPYPVVPAQNSATTTKGLVTWMQTGVLNPATTATTVTAYLSSVNIYDDKGQLLQVQAQNITGGTDITTTQYTWAEQPLIKVQAQQKGGGNPQTTLIVTATSYNALNRPVQLQKKIGNSLVNGGTQTGWVTTATKQYDALGQLKTKNLGNKPSGPGTYTTIPLETQNFEYNIRGWLLGMNRAYVWNSAYLNASTSVDATGTSGETYSGPNGSPNYFGFELSYDKPGSNYNTAQYNGNIAGMAWKGANDIRLRKYDYTYDATNRLTGATFNQWTTGSFTNQYVNFSTGGIDYDPNGNILHMNQSGMQLGTNAIINVDILTYTYFPGTSRLQQVVDAGNNASTTTLGDFHYASGVAFKTIGGSTDYTYDINGNLNADANKSINSIAYNYLNLPCQVNVTNHGSIQYTYDAMGNKLQKKTTEGSNLITTTTYLDGFVYVNDVLQSMPQEEGRIRVNNNVYVFDYYLKDYLGNTRMTITDDYSYSNVIVDWTNYYAFGLTMVGISSTASGPLENKYKYNGKEEQRQEFSDGSGLDIIGFEFRMYDGQIGRFWQSDPITDQMPNITSYSFAANNPISYKDLLGLSPYEVTQTWSTTYVDKNNRVLDVVNDGSLDVIRFDDLDVSSWNGSTNELQSKTNGNKIGQTVYWYDFMNYDEAEGTVTTPMKGTQIDNPISVLNSDLNEILQNSKNRTSGTGNTIFGSAILLLQLINGDFSSSSNLETTMLLVNLAYLAYNSRNGGIYDLKSNVLQANSGYLFNVENGTNIYTTGKGLGNMLFGMNMNSVQDESVLSKNAVWNIGMRTAGYYNEHHNGDQKDQTFYGEHPYSGSFIYFGYWGTKKSGF